MIIIIGKNKMMVILVSVLWFPSYISKDYGSAKDRESLPYLTRFLFGSQKVRKLILRVQSARHYTIEPIGS